MLALNIAQNSPVDMLVVVKNHAKLQADRMADRVYGLKRVVSVGSKRKRKFMKQSIRILNAILYQKKEIVMVNLEKIWGADGTNPARVPNLKKIKNSMVIRDVGALMLPNSEEKVQAAVCEQLKNCSQMILSSQPVVVKVWR